MLTPIAAAGILLSKFIWISCDLKSHQAAVLFPLVMTPVEYGQMPSCLWLQLGVVERFYLILVVMLDYVHHITRVRGYRSN